MNKGFIVRRSDLRPGKGTGLTWERRNPDRQVLLPLTFTKEERAHMRTRDLAVKHKRATWGISKWTRQPWLRCVWSDGEVSPKERAKPKVDAAMSKNECDEPSRIGCILYLSDGRDIFADIVGDTTTCYVVEYWEFPRGLVRLNVPMDAGSQDFPHVHVPNGVITRRMHDA